MKKEDPVLGAQEGEGQPTHHTWVWSRGDQYRWSSDVSGHYGTGRDCRNCRKARSGLNKMDMIKVESWSYQMP